MAKILICEKCLDPECDAREFKLPVDYNWSRTLCSSECFKKDGKVYYHYVRAHGDYWDIEVEEVG